MTQKNNTIKWFPLDFKEAHHLADLEGIKKDLEWVIAAGHSYGSIGRILYPILPEALCVAIVIKYARSHKESKRRKIPKKWIEELSPEEQAEHEYIMNLRDKFFAHSDNDFEGNYSVAYVKNPNSLNPEFDQVQTHHQRVLSLSLKDILRFVKLSERLLKKVDKQIKKEKPLVIEKAKQIPLDELIKHRLSDWVPKKATAGQSRDKKIIKS